MRHFYRFPALAALSFLIWACDGKDPVPSPEPDQAPTSMTLSLTSQSVPAAGGSYELEITAPVRPSFSSSASWLTYVDGTYKDYSIKITVNVAANETYEQRSSTLSVKSGTLSGTLTINQEAAEKPQEPDIPTPPSPPDNEAVKLFKALGLGWNMGNQFDGYYNGSWAGDKEGYPEECVWQPNDGHKATQATFDGVKAAGFTAVRIPVSWLKMIGPAPDYTIDEAWINRVYEVVQYAHNAGLYVILNTHHDENHGVTNDYQWLDVKNAVNNSALNETIKAKIKGTWTNIANKFKDCGDWLILESFNEINDGGWGWSESFRADPTKQCNILNEWNQVFVDAVRATGGNNSTRWLAVPTYAANPEYEKYFTMPSDEAGKMILAVHFYDPSDYTLDVTYSDWGHTGASGKKANGGDEDHVKEVFNNLYTKYISKNIPVYLGEFGCSMRSKSDTRAWAFYKYYLEYVTKVASTYCLPAFLWDNGGESDGKEQHGYIHHGTGNYIGNSKELVDIMLRGMTNDDEGYTLETVYNSAPKF